MKFGIVGNNDGPLVLLKSLKRTHYHPEFIGFQKEPSVQLRKTFQEFYSDEIVFWGFGEPELLKIVKNYDIELLINCFCNFKFNELLAQPFEVINIHLSILPQYRGRHPLQWVLINGENRSGFTIHAMNKDYDAGEILYQKEVKVHSEMSVGELRNNIMQQLENYFSEFIKLYEEKAINTKKNDDSFATYAPRRFPSESKLSEWHDSGKIYRKIKAMRSEEYPAFIVFKDGLSLTCVNVEWSEKESKKVARPIVKEISDNKIKIVCLDGNSLWITVKNHENTEDIINQEIEGYR